MWQTITIWIIITLSAFFVGRRLYRHFRSATGCVGSSASKNGPCGCCSTPTACSTVKSIPARKKKA